MPIYLLSPSTILVVEVFHIKNMIRLQQLNKSQIIKLLKAIKCEEVDSEFWDVFSSNYIWNADEVFGSGGNIFFEPGDYITVMYNSKNPFPTLRKYSSIISNIPHYYYRIEEDLKVLIFKVKSNLNRYTMIKSNLNK